MKRYESRYCSYDVPDDWEPQPPYGYAEPTDAEYSMSVQALERWLDQPMAPIDYAEGEKEVLPHLLDRFELLDEGVHTLERGLGEAYFLSYNSVNEDNEPIVAKKIYLTRGPYFVEMELSRPGEDDPPRADLMERIARTLTLRHVSFMDRYEPFVFFPDEEQGEEARLTEERRSFPRCCVSLPLMAGWELTEDDGDAVYRRSGAEIRLNRPVGIEPDAEVWLSDKMRWIEDTQSLLFSSDRGELETGEPYAAVVYEKVGETRKWNTAATQRVLEVVVEAEQVLLWSLRSPESTFHHNLPTTRELITAPELLDPSKWETALAEPWINLLLRGGWRSEGPGVYCNLEEELILQPNREPNRAPLVDLKPSIIESLRSSVDQKREFQEQEQSGKWQGADALKYSVDGSSPTGEPLNIRSIWCNKKQTLYSTVILSRETQVADQQFETLTNALELP